jgi:manganese transport system ATP-binding protein
MRHYYTKLGMNKTPYLKIDSLNIAYGQELVLKNLSLEIPLGPITGIVGPNGAGKSSLLKVFSLLKKPQSGHVMINDKPLSFFQNKIAYVPQKKEMNLEFPILVEEVVAQGALLNKKWYQGLSKQDFIKARQILKQLDLEAISKKSIAELSGGQQQRVFLARALMQDAELLLLDEPFAGLDIVSEEKLMSELKKLASLGLHIFIVHHDLHSWKKYFQQLIILKNELIAAGDILDVFTKENLEKAYGLSMQGL